jgi:hypothetical protein
MPSPAIWRSIRTGMRLGGDGILFLPPDHNQAVIERTTSARKTHPL